MESDKNATIRKGFDMKRLLISTILLLSCLVVQAHISYYFSSEFANYRDHYYTANSHITLAPGFKAQPIDGHEVVLVIDSYGVFPPVVGETGGPQFLDNGVVGTLDGTLNVGKLGAANYTIPLHLPDGLGGITPQLGICYNSQARNGLLGWAWDLAGISAITRTGRNLYYDGIISPGNYVADRFLLDGQRLLQIGGGTYGNNGISYRTEEDQLYNITSYTESGYNGPSYFVVKTSNGQTLYYGNSTDSKALVDANNHVNIWLIKKVVDPYGNKMEYHYEQTSDSYRIDRITYSANSNDGISAAYTVEFQYETREDYELVYLGHTLFNKRHLLTDINVKGDDAQLYNYHFTYADPNPQQGYYYHLLQEIKLTAGNQHYNPTRIQWGNNNYPISSSANVKKNVTTNGVSNAFNNAVKFSGDFNGDGFTDVIATRPNSEGYYTTAELFVNKGVSNTLQFDYLRDFTLDANASWIYVGDFDGNGMDDILFANRIRTPAIFPDKIKADVYLSKFNSLGNLVFTRYPTPLVSIPSSMVEGLLLGDLLGKGKDLFLIQSVNEGNGGQNNSILFEYDSDIDDFVMQTFEEHLDATRFFPADYNGDGLTEILYKKQSGSTAITKLTLENGSPHYVELSNTSIITWEDCFPGDYNGDGMTDVLFYNSGSTNRWKIYLSTTTELSPYPYPLPDNFAYTSPGNYQFSLDNPHHSAQYIKVGDFDGNGCADLALYKENNFHVYYGPIKTEGSNAPFTNHQSINKNIFGFYDNMGICLGNFLGQDRISFLGNTTVSFLPALTLRHEVKELTDGLGRKTTLQYDYLMPNPQNPSEDDFYRKISTQFDFNRRIYCTYLPIRALKQVSTTNVSEKAVTYRCYYEGALVHKHGKGFLGFSKTKQKDYINNELQKTTLREYNCEPLSAAIFMAASQEEVFDKDNNLTAKSTYHNKVFTHTNNNKVFVLLNDPTQEEYDPDHPNTLLKKEIQETTVGTNCQYTYEYNNIIYITSTYIGITDLAQHTLPSQCEFQKTTLTTYAPNNLTNWVINRPSIITTTYHREGGYEDICSKTIYSYNANKPRQVTSVTILPNDGSQPGDPLSTVTTYEYDAVGNITKQTVSAANDNLEPRWESFEYSKTYGRRKLTKQTNALGQVTTYTYDPVYGFCTSVTDCNGLVTRYQRSPLGNNTSTIYPDGTVACTALRWEDENFLQWEKKTGQPTKITLFAPTGEVLGTTGYDIEGNALVSNLEYDAYGRKKSQQMPHKEGETVSSLLYNYNTHHQVNEIIHPDGTYETIDYEGSSSSATFHALDGETQTETKTFNVMGWLIQSTDAHGTSVIYDYEPDGKLHWSQIEGHPETRIEMSYDGMRNRTSLSDPNYGVTTYQYNAYRELVRQTNPKMDRTDYCYDKLGNKVSRTETDHQTGAVTTTTWSYYTGGGKKGLLKKISSEHQVIQYEYDDLLRLCKTNEQCLGANYVTTYTYDEASRNLETTYPSGYQVRYAYTSEGIMRCISDAQSNVLWKANEMNSMGQPLRCTLGDELVTHYEYDPNTHRLLGIMTQSSRGTLQNERYDYDDFSNMIARMDLRHGYQEQFSYDALNRLTGVTDPDGVSSFTYDPLGRMTGKTSKGQKVFSNADYTGQRPYAIKSAQTLQGVFPENRMNLTFNEFDKVATITEGSTTLSFLYGFEQQRIKMTEQRDGVTTEKYYIGNCEYVQRSGSSPIVRTFLSNPTGVFAVAETIDGETHVHYILKDHLGSWRVITNEQGTVEQENRFDAWGLPESQEPLLFDRGYTGHEHLQSVGLINMNGRLYDPMTSSMLSPDNNIQSPDFSQNFNRYAYCLNNPLSYTDPDGNTFLEMALLFYLTYCTDYGYEIQKWTNFFAFHIDLHISSQQMGIGFDVSLGLPKEYIGSWRVHAGATYYWHFYDNSYSGWELRAGSEMYIAGAVGISNTTFLTKAGRQTTNSINIGTKLVCVSYENDYMFHLFDELIGFVPADNGDRYRTAAAKIRVGPFYIGVNLFTGNPGFKDEDRMAEPDPENNGRMTYVINNNGDDPDQYRAGLLYLGAGPFRFGVNSEKVRNALQNRFAHDFLCGGRVPYFKVLDRPDEFYFYFGTETGDTLW